MEEKIKLRDKLADIALQWQASFGVAPSITSSISEYDAAMLVGMSEKEYSDYMRDKTAVAKGTDFPSKKPIHLRLFSPSRNAAEAQAFAFSIPQKKRQLSIAILNANH